MLWWHWLIMGRFPHSWNSYIALKALQSNSYQFQEITEQTTSLIPSLKYISILMDVCFSFSWQHVSEMIIKDGRKTNLNS